MSVEVELTVPERDVEVGLDGRRRRDPRAARPQRLRQVDASSACWPAWSGPTAGRVSIDGEVLTDVGPGRPGVMVAPHARRTALLGQDALLFPHLDALENVAFGPRSSGYLPPDGARGRPALARRGRRRRAAGAATAQLSGGQAQRVAVARALAADPRVLLLDEPMAALDVAVQPALRQVLRRVLADRTAIVVTHDPLDALLLADRVVVLEAGRVVEDGPSREVLSRPRSAFAARLAGLNLVRGTWRDGAVRCRARWSCTASSRGRPPADGDAAIAAFRPQAVAVYREEVHGSPRNAFPVTVTERRAPRRPGPRARRRAWPPMSPCRRPPTSSWLPAAGSRSP